MVGQKLAQFHLNINNKLKAKNNFGLNFGTKYILIVSINLITSCKFIRDN